MRNILRDTCAGTAILVATIVVGSGAALSAWWIGAGDGEGGSAEAPAALQAIAAMRAIDLTHPVDERAPSWPGPGEGPPFRAETTATLEREGYFARRVSMPEHFGTHLDAPCHFERFRRAVDEIPLERLRGEAVVFDISERAAKDRDAALGAADIEAFERANGRVPAGAIAILRTGYAGRAADPAAYSGRDAAGKLHFPGLAPDAARLLVERGVHGVGIDTLSIDRGIAAGFEVHHILGAAEVFVLENLTAAVADLPPRGAVVIALPLKLKGGSGGPARVVALVPAR